MESFWINRSVMCKKFFLYRVLVNTVKGDSEVHFFEDITNV